MKFSGVRLQVSAIGLMMAANLVFSHVPIALAQAGDGCGVAPELSAMQAASADTLARNADAAPEDMSCQNVAGATADARSTRCIATGLCSGGPDRVCCLPGTGATRGRTGTGTTEPTTAAPAPAASALRLQLPACVADGNCGLDDIIETGVNFSNFLFGISGAIFLAIFVYAGFKYIFFASVASEASSAKGMLVNATIGIILMFGASALVTTTYNAFRAGSSGGGDAQCAAAYPTYSCQALSANWEDESARKGEITSRSCQSGLCGADNHLVCCPPTGSAGTAGGAGTPTLPGGGSLPSIP